MRSKKELIEQFIEENLPQIDDSAMINNEFDQFWDKEKVKAFNEMCNELNLQPKKIQNIIGDYLFTERKPLGDEIVDALKEKPKILQRRSVIERVTKKILDFIEIFIEEI